MKTRRILTASIAILLTTAVTHAADQTATWDSTTGNWSDFTKWSTNPLFPNNGNGGFTYDAIQNGGSLIVDQAITIEKFTLTGGNLQGTQTLTLNDMLNWTGGSMQMAGITDVNGGAAISGPDQKVLFGGRVVNLNSTASWTGGQINFNSGTLNNSAGNTFTTNFDGALNSTGGVNAFTNAGTFTKSGGAGSTVITGVPFANTGTVNVNSGTLNLSTDSTNSGALAVAAGSTVLFPGNNHQMNAGSVFSGAGTLSLAGGNVFFNAALSTPASMTVNLSNGNLTGTGTLAVNGPLNWTGGSMQMAGITNVNGGAAISGTDQKVLFGGRVVNLNSTASWTGGQINFNSGTLNNSAGNTFTTNFDGALNSTGGVNAFTNAGIFTKSGGAGSTVITGVPFANTGTVNVNSGTLNLSTDSTNSGALAVAAGSTVLFPGNNHQMNAGSVFSGAGTLSLAGGNVFFNAALSTPASMTVNLSNGNLTGTGTLAVNGPLNWTGGSMQMAGITNVNGGAAISGTDQKVLFGGRVVNLNSTASWTGGQINFNSGTLNNSAGNTFTTNFDGALNSTGGVNAFTNAGIFTKSAGAGSTASSVPFSNTGTVNANSGTLSLTSTVTQHSGTTLTAGTWNVRNGASIDITTGSNIITNQGTVLLDGAGSSFNRLTTALNNNQGSFTIRNDRDLTTAGAYANSGTTRIEDAPTALTIGAGASAAYTQTAGVTTLLGGSTLNASAFNLNGGLLEGTGTIALGLNGDLIAQSGAQISPGNSAGTLALVLSSGGDFILTNAIAAAASGALLFELGTISDLMTVTGGAMHIGAGLMEFDDFMFTPISGFGAGIYTLIDGNMAINGTLGSSLGGIIGGYNASLAFGDSGNDLILTVVPEPGTALVGITLLGVALGRRRRR